MKRTVAAFTILVGLTAVMISLYLNETSKITDLLRTFTIPFP